MTVSLVPQDGPGEDFEGISTPALDKLHPRHRMFVLHYVLGDDNTRGQLKGSAEKAGFSTGASASVTASRLIRFPDVRQAIKELQTFLEKDFELQSGSWAKEAYQAKELIGRSIETALNPDLPLEKKVFPTPSLLAACSIAIERFWGKPKQVHQVEAGQKLEDLIKSITEQRQKREEEERKGLRDLQEIQPLGTLPSNTE